MDARFRETLADRYRIERKLGAGGMATVHLAHDLKHDRKVALKLLHPELAVALGAERFLQEIRTTANLQHPHILGLIDSGQVRVPAGEMDGGGPWLYFVMPYVEGESLRDRLRGERQLPIETAVRITREVASALDFAHRRGVIHRDIKPENILLQDGQALVADFGIALAVQHARGSRMTQTGMSLGTPQYMAPEQAMGERTIDARTDVFALGAVLYEMLLGEPPFNGPTLQAIVAKVMTERPISPASVRDTVPAHVDKAVLKALANLPADRFETAAEFGRTLGDPVSTSSAAQARRGGWTVRAPWLVAGALAVALLLVAERPPSRHAAYTGTARFSVGADPSVNVQSASTNPFGISPDGRTIVFRATSPGDERGQLWIRRLDEPRPRPLDGTEGGQQPTISPDGQWLAFVVLNEMIRKMPVAGGPVTTVVPLDYVSASLAWLSDDEILFETLGPRGIQRVSATSGTPREAVPLDTENGEVRQRRPFVVPGTDVVVFASVHQNGATELMATSLSSGRREALGLDGIHAIGVIDGRLVYTRLDGALMAAPFDATRLRVTGSPVHLGERVASFAAGTAAALSPTGTLVYRPGAVASHLVVVDADGEAVTLTSTPRALEAPRFSPDGRRIAVGIASGAGGMDLWLIDRTSRELRRLTTLGNTTPPEWSPDGTHLIYAIETTGGSEVWRLPVDGGAPASRLLELPGSVTDAVMTPDGETLVVRRIDPETGIALELAALNGDSAPVPLVTSGSPSYPRVSPDGRWLAYTTIRAVSEVFVRPIGGGGEIQVSLRGGFEPIWAPDSQRLVHRAFDSWTEVTLDTSTTPSVVSRRTVLRASYHASLTRANYDIAPDGQSFVILEPEQKDDDVFIALGWADQMQALWRTR